MPSRPIGCFAGVWRPAENGPVFAFLTAVPNRVVTPIHPKAMPVIVHDDDDDRWRRAQIEEALTMAAPFPAQLMTVAESEYPARETKLV